jgi:RNA polymerase-binding transcription factor DksA
MQSHDREDEEGMRRVNPHDHDDEVRARLGALRREVEQRAAGLADGFDAIVEAATDVATDDEHDPEGHTIAWERQQIAALLTEARAALDGIEAATSRLSAGRYGICTVCAEPIAPERLEALPATPTCVTCAGRRSR